MILKKTTIDEKVMYVPISYEEALLYANKDELVFTSEDEQDEFNDKLEELEENKEKVKELNDNIECLTKKIDNLDDETRSKYLTKLEQIKENLSRLKSNVSDDAEDMLDDIEDALDEMDDEVDEFIDRSEENNDMVKELSSSIECITKKLNDLDDENKSQYLTKLEPIKESLNKLKNNISDDIEDILDDIENELDKMDDEIDEIIDKLDEDNYKCIFSSKDNKCQVHIKDFSKTFKESFGNISNKNKNSKANELTMALPFMGKDDLNEVVKNILNEYEEYKDLNLITVMPFLDTKDCDDLFIKFVLEGKNSKYPIVTLAPFVSKDCLSSLVDEYVKGNFQEIEMNTIYPFLDSKDVKRVFNYILSKKYNN